MEKNYILTCVGKFTQRKYWAVPVKNDPQGRCEWRDFGGDSNPLKMSGRTDPQGAAKILGLPVDLYAYFVYEKAFSYSKFGPDFTIDAIREELKAYIETNNIKSLVLGISGGIDSALCAALARPVCDELSIPLVGRSITIESNSNDEKKRAREVGAAFCTDFDELNLTNLFHEFAGKKDGFDSTKRGNVRRSGGGYWATEYIFGDRRGDAGKIARGNIKARLRMITLYDIAGVSGGMVLSTDNLTEYLLGFSTIMGDWGDFGMIQNLWKTEVYDISEHLAKSMIGEALASGDTAAIAAGNALLSCVHADATDGLGISNTDLDQIMPDWKERHESTRSGYAEVDEILKDYIDGGGCDIHMADNPVIQRHTRTHWKRNWPINIERDKIILRS